MCNHMCKGKPSCGHQILQKGIKSSGSGELCHAVALFTDVITSAGIILHAITQRKKKEGKRERHTSNRGRIKREERKPTRCNNIDDLLSMWMLIIDTVSTCFGHLYAHLQEKDHVLLHMECICW